MSRNDRILAIIEQVERLVDLANDDPNEYRKIALLTVAKRLMEEARELTRPRMPRRRTVLCLQWFVALWNGFTFWWSASDGSYVWAAISLFFVFSVARWKIPPKEKME